MIQKPRPFTTTFFNWKELDHKHHTGTNDYCRSFANLSIRRMAQIITNPLHEPWSLRYLIAANIILTLVNRSFYFSILTTLKYKNNLVPLIIGITIGITALLIFVGPFTRFFGFETLNFVQLTVSFSAGFTSVIWYELVKWWKRIQV